MGGVNQTPHGDQVEERPSQKYYVCLHARVRLKSNFQIKQGDQILPDL